jgi:L-2,4-diaminobutyrate decarboxylase
MADQMGLESLLKNGELTEESTVALVEKYLENTQHMHHPGYIGHQVAVPHLFSALADMIHGFVNNPMAIYEMGPAPATMEKVVLNWMLDKIGWFHADTLHESDDKKIGGGGVLTHGGSLANLTALLAARAKLDPNAWTEGLSEPLYVLAPEPTHYSIARAVSIMGMGAKNLVPIPLNEYEQIIPAKLDELLRTMQKEGKRVMAVVANACATSTGLYDPLDAVGDICRRYGVWYHIDGAHGAGALLTDKYKSWMKGCDKADSMIWDAHKMLRTPALSAAVLIKRHEDLANTFRQKGSYIFFEKEQIGYDFMHNTVECTKAPLGTKIFFALAAEGEQGIGDYIEDRYRKTHDFYSLIHSQEDFECPCEPQANILCFRYTGGDSSDAFQLALRNALINRGNFYITSTTIQGTRYLRLTVMNHLTDVLHIEALLDEIRLVAGGLVNG